jgi:hypothetical protein
MFVLVAAVIASHTPSVPRPGSGASVEAIATIRVISGVRLNLRAPNGPDVPPPRDTMINTGRDQQQPARLVEFQ